MYMHTYIYIQTLISSTVDIKWLYKIKIIESVAAMFNICVDKDVYAGRKTLFFCVCTQNDITTVMNNLPKQ